MKSFYCCLCRGEARQITTHRSSRSYASWLLDALAYPLTRGLIPLVATAVILSLLFFGVPKIFDPDRPQPSVALQTKTATPAAAGAADTAHRVAKDDASSRLPSTLIYPAVRAFIIFLFVVLIAARMPRSGRRDPMPYALPFKALATTLVVWLPGVAYLVLVQKGMPDARTFGEPLPLLHVALAGVFLPVAVLGAAADNPWREIVNPFRVFTWAWNVGWRYWLTVMFLAALAALGLHLGKYMSAIERAVFIPGVQTFVAELVVMIPFAMVGRLAGWLLFVHGEAFDWGLPADYQDPVLKADATGIRKSLAGDAESAEGATTTSPAVREKPESSLARDVIMHMEEKNFSRALKIYASRPSWTPTLFTDRHLFDLGSAAVRAKKYDEAERLLLAAEAKGGLLTPRALLSLAGLYADALHAPEKAVEIYRRIVDKFPSSDQAKVAARKLEEGKNQV